MSSSQHRILHRILGIFRLVICRFYLTGKGRGCIEIDPAYQTGCIEIEHLKDRGKTSIL